MAEVAEQQRRLLLALIAQQAAVRVELRTSVVRQVVAILRRGMRGRWYQDADRRPAARQIQQVVYGGQQAVAGVTEEYLTQVLAVLDVRAPPARYSVPPDLRGVPAQVEWERPAAEFRRLRAAGLDELDAELRAEQRAERLASDDLDLAMRHAARRRLALVDGITGYRRVIHPELSKSGTCGLCIAAADRVYAKADLMPIHDGCQCEPFPIVRGQGDPARTFNEADTAELYRRALHAAGGDTSRLALRRVRIQVSEHGELGPVLHDAGHRFRDQRTAAADLRTA